MRLKSPRRCGGASTEVRRRRSWDDLDYNILVEIIKRLHWYWRLFIVCLVNKTWLSAVLDSMSANDGVMDLRILDSPEFELLQPRYCRFLKRLLDKKPIDSWSTLILGENLLYANKYSYIARRTPSLKQLIIPSTLAGARFTCLLDAFDYWKKLKQVQCPAWLVYECRNGFRWVERLQLFGFVDDAAAITIRDLCPRLKQLILNSCIFSLNALSIILDGHKDLELLDTRHGFRVSQPYKPTGIVKPVEWNEEEICRKAAGIKTYLRCDQQLCVQCAQPYRVGVPQPSASPKGARCWVLRPS